jgi:uncharacterized membrane protein
MDVKRSVTIDRPADDLYRYWRNFENLPRFMSHLESVSVQSDLRSHWIANGPLGMRVEWDAEIVEDCPGELISWRSVDDSDVRNMGTVRFSRAPGDRGTVVQVEIGYKPPAGALGSAVAKLFGEEPEIQVFDDLRAFKQVSEVGEVVRSDGSLERGHVAQHPARPAA